MSESYYCPKCGADTSNPCGCVDESYNEAHGYTVDLIDVVKAMRPSLLPSYQEFVAKWVVNPKGHKIDKN